MKVARKVLLVLGLSLAANGAWAASRVLWEEDGGDGCGAGCNNYTECPNSGCFICFPNPFAWPKAGSCISLE